MSEKQKSGEDLIEKVEQQTAEAVEETKEESAFDPKAFSGTETKEEEKVEKVEEAPSSAEEEEESNEDDFSWDKVEVDTKEEEQEEEEVFSEWEDSQVEWHKNIGKDPRPSQY